jgi:tripartite-type tricarboxylate transporter receptor subunit TctC
MGIGARFALALLAGAMTCASAPARTETWPVRPVRIILPLPAGLGTDLAARLFAEKLAVRWGQPVVVENRPGADGIVGVTSFVNAHDDHTLLFSFAGPISINPLIHDKLPYDPVRDLVPIATAIDNFFAIAVSTPTGVRSLHSFIEAARADPAKFNWAATAGLPQFIFLALQKRAGLALTQVPYRDFGPALQDFSENRVQVLVTSPSTLLLAIESGKALLLMVTNRRRSPIAPEVPTAAEAGFPELTFDGVVGFFGGRDPPVALRDRIAGDVAAVAEIPELILRLQAVGVAVRAGTPAQFSVAIEEQHAKVREIVSTEKWPADGSPRAPETR